MGKMGASTLKNKSRKFSTNISKAEPCQITSATANATATATIAASTSGARSSNSAVFPSSYMRLDQAATTWFRWHNKEISVRGAPPDVFDAFIAQVVERILNVDRKVWPIFHRWRIVNDALHEQALELHPDAAGFRLCLPEEKPSTSELPTVTHVEEKTSGESDTFSGLETGR